MTRQRHRAGSAAKKRTTLTLPLDSLTHAERIARARKVTLSTVISEAVAEGLKVHDALERTERVMEAYKTAFSGFTDEDMALLNGVILEPARGRLK
jgi:hypothetical protein